MLGAILNVMVGVQSGRWRGVLLALYVFTLALTPALHCDDVDCLFKAPAHCQACLASPSAEPPSAALQAWSGRLPLVGHVAPAVVRLLPRSAEVEIPGRAPPV